MKTVNSRSENTNPDISSVPAATPQVMQEWPSYSFDTAIFYSWPYDTRRWCASYLLSLIMISQNSSVKSQKGKRVAVASQQKLQQHLHVWASDGRLLHTFEWQLSQQWHWDLMTLLYAAHPFSTIIQNMTIIRIWYGPWNPIPFGYSELGPNYKTCAVITQVSKYASQKVFLQILSRWWGCT